MVVHLAVMMQQRRPRIPHHCSREAVLEVVAAFSVLREIEAVVFIRFAEAQAAGQDFGDLKDDE